MLCGALVNGIIVFLAVLTNVFASHLSRTSADQGAWYLISEKKLPANSVAAGYDGVLKLYICRSNSIAGYTYDDVAKCYLGHENKRYDVTSFFEVLVDFQGVWTPFFANSAYPNNSFVISYQSSGKPAYYGRTRHGLPYLLMGSMYNRVLYVADNNRAPRYASDYEIYTSVPDHRVVGVLGNNPRYRFIGDYMTFRLKADPSVEIALVFEGGNVPVVLKFDNKKFTLTETAVIYAANMSRFISATEYNGFWLYRKGATMKLGVEGNLYEEFSCEFEGVSNINKVTFTSDGRSYWYLPGHEILGPNDSY